MFRKYLIAALLVFVWTISFAAEEGAFLKEERIGSLRLDLSEKEVVKKVHCQVKRGPEQLQGADGMYHQDWVFRDCGITLGMASEKKGRPKSVVSIEATGRSELKTGRGIGIGSTEEEVMKAYGAYRDAEASRKGKSFVAGSVFGGLIFTFRNGRVSAMFLGAAAE